MPSGWGRAFHATFQSGVFMVWCLPSQGFPTSTGALTQGARRVFKPPFPGRPDNRPFERQPEGVLVLCFYLALWESVRSILPVQGPARLSALRRPMHRGCTAARLSALRRSMRWGCNRRGRGRARARARARGRGRGRGRGTRNEERGTRNEERGTRNEERGRYGPWVKRSSPLPSNGGR